MKRTNKQAELQPGAGPGGFRTLLEIRSDTAKQKKQQEKQSQPQPRARTTIKIHLSEGEFSRAQLQLEAFKTQELIEASNAKWKHVHQEMDRVTAKRKDEKK